MVSYHCQVEIPPNQWDIQGSLKVALAFQRSLPQVKTNQLIFLCFFNTGVSMPAFYLLQSHCLHGPLPEHPLRRKTLTSPLSFMLFRCVLFYVFSIRVCNLTRSLGKGEEYSEFLLPDAMLDTSRTVTCVYFLSQPFKESSVADKSPSFQSLFPV